LRQTPKDAGVHRLETNADIGTRSAMAQPKLDRLHLPAACGYATRHLPDLSVA
jgi:hypothetical protein